MRRPRGASPCRRWKWAFRRRRTTSPRPSRGKWKRPTRRRRSRSRGAPRRRPPGPDAARPAAPHPTPTFDDSQYTTALDAAALTPQQRADAEKIARKSRAAICAVDKDGLLAAAPHPDYDARQEGQLLSRQPTLDKTDPTLEEYEAMRKAQLAAGPPGLAPPSAQSSPNGVEATSVSFDAEDDALDAALLDAGLANDLRTRDILRWEGIDAHSLMYLEYEDYVNLDLRMGARAKLRRWAASQRSEPVPDWLKCPLSQELFDDPVLLDCRFENL